MVINTVCVGNTQKLYKEHPFLLIVTKHTPYMAVTLYLKSNPGPTKLIVKSYFAFSPSHY